MMKAWISRSEPTLAVSTPNSTEDWDRAKQAPADATPRNPPSRLTIRDSARIIRRTCPLLQPTARSTPISRVRSMTDISWAFIIPTPPIMIARPPIAHTKPRHVRHGLVVSEIVDPADGKIGPAALDPLDKALTQAGVL